MPQPSAQLSISHLLPLPGIVELEGAINGLRKDFNAAGYANEECESLAVHLENLLDTARSADKCEDFIELLSELTDVRRRLDAEFKRKSRIGMMRSQRRLELLGNLDREVTRIVTRYQFKLLAQLRVTQQKNSILENIPTISRHEIALRDEHPNTSRSLISCKQLCHFQSTVGSRSELIATSRHAGYYGKLPVIYQTYSSKSDNMAAEQAEMDLKTLSKLAHKNIASVIAVTKGCYGINGIAMHIDATATLSPSGFLCWSMPGASLACYVSESQCEYYRLSFQCLQIRGVHAAFVFLHMHHEEPNWPPVEDVIVGSNGHITVLPSTKSMNKPVLREYNPFDLLGQYQNLEPGPNLILSRQFELHHNSYRVGGPNSTEAQDFLNEISTLPPGFSKLQVLKLAAKIASLSLPPISHHYVELSTPHSFVMRPGDIGSTAGLQSGSWEALHVGGEFDIKVVNYQTGRYSSGTCGKGCCWKSCSSASSEYSTWVNHCAHGLTGIELNMSGSDPGRGDIIQSAREVSSKHNINLDELSYCSMIELSVFFTGEGTQHQCPIYFHRNQLYHSSPRAFWGFFSTSSDPHSQSTGLEELDGNLKYELRLDLFNICDDWGIKYEAALEEGLESMPGGYPRVGFEQALDEMAE